MAYQAYNHGDDQELKPCYTASGFETDHIVGKIKSLNSNSNLKSNLDRTCFEISNLKV